MVAKIIDLCSQIALDSGCSCFECLLGQPHALRTNAATVDGVVINNINVRPLDVRFIRETIAKCYLPLVLLLPSLSLQRSCLCLTVRVRACLF